MQFFRWRGSGQLLTSDNYYICFAISAFPSKQIKGNQALSAGYPLFFKLRQLHQGKYQINFLTYWLTAEKMNPG